MMRSTGAAKLDLQIEVFGPETHMTMIVPLWLWGCRSSRRSRSAFPPLCSAGQQAVAAQPCAVAVRQQAAAVTAISPSRSSEGRPQAEWRNQRRQQAAAVGPRLADADC